MIKSEIRVVSETTQLNPTKCTVSCVVATLHVILFVFSYPSSDVFFVSFRSPFLPSTRVLLSSSFASSSRLFLIFVSFTSSSQRPFVPYSVYSFYPFHYSPHPRLKTFLPTISYPLFQVASSQLHIVPHFIQNNTSLFTALSKRPHNSLLFRSNGIFSLVKAIRVFIFRSHFVFS